MKKHNTKRAATTAEPARNGLADNQPTASQVFLRGFLNDLAKVGAGHGAEWLAVAHRFPDECRDLFNACDELARFFVDRCNGSTLDEVQEAAELEHLTEAVESAALALIGPGVTVTTNGDPRGLPVFLSWPGMNDRLRCGWTPERGLPVIYAACDLNTEAFIPPALLD